MSELSGTFFLGQFSCILEIFQDNDDNVQLLQLIAQLQPKSESEKKEDLAEIVDTGSTLVESRG